MNTFSYYKHPALEADDGLGIISTMPGNENTIIVSDDKDMLTVPAKVYRPGQDLLVDVTSDEADKLYMQTLAGDAVDGYPGIPGVERKESRGNSRRTTSMVISRTGLPETWLVKRRRNPKRTTSSYTAWSDWDAQNKSVNLWTPDNR